MENGFEKWAIRILKTASYDNGKIYGLAPAEFKKMVNDLGMKCTSAHLGQAFTKEKEAEVMSWWDQAIDAHNELGVKYMVQPWMPVTDQTTLDDLKMYCDYFNTVGYKTQPPASHSVTITMLLNSVKSEIN